MTNTIDPISYNAGIEAADAVELLKVVEHVRHYLHMQIGKPLKPELASAPEIALDQLRDLIRSLPAPATDGEAEKLADAMWQLLDDMGDGHTVCEQAKQDAIAAYEPFRLRSQDRKDV